MKKILFTLVIVSLAFASCKTKKVVSSYTPPVAKEEVAAENSNIESAAETPVLIKSEEVSIAENEDVSRDGYAFYVIIGSFSKVENAAKFKRQLIDKGFSPVLLNGENGYVRLAVDQSNSEKEARSAVMKIREKYPEHSDVWLLKRK